MYDQYRSSRKVAEAFGCGRDQIQRIIRRRDEIVKKYGKSATMYQQVGSELCAEDETGCDNG